MNANGPAKTEFLPTRVSLLEDITDPANIARWEEFIRTYGKLIRVLAARSGLTADEADEAVQETWVSVAQTIGGFQYNPKECSFKSWLGMLAQRRIVDQLRKRPPRGRQVELPPEPDTDTDALALVPDPAGGDPTVFWDTEYEKTVESLALERLKQQVKPLHFQIFHLHVARQQSAADVAKAVGVSVGQVYLVKLRVKKKYKRIVAGLLKGPT